MRYGTSNAAFETGLRPTPLGEAHEAGRLAGRLLSHFGMHQFIGAAPSFMTAIQRIPRIAACGVTVLLNGETGTGKEMCARAIHQLSPRASGPFVPVDCGSIPLDLFENELFGHEPGAYTDARRSRPGLITEAEGGTLFLDEVEALGALAQTKLLRFLQEHTFKPLGASRYRDANTRIIAATNEDLHRKTGVGEFRKDLYYRLNVVSLRLPPLRHRREDILLLARHFLCRAGREYGQFDLCLSPHAEDRLLDYAWPGNVRELENVIRQAIFLSETSTIRPVDIRFVPEETGPSSAPGPTRESLKVAKAQVIATFERGYLTEVLAACDGNISRAARQAQKNRRAFFALLKKYELVAPHPRCGPTAPSVIGGRASPLDGEPISNDE